ncbi:MAG: LysR family transcriptional regulator [Steroidobacteraceae bacterium]
MNSSRPLNLKHLRYFVEIARRGSISSAARALHVAPQTVSGQVLELEAAAGQQLFERVGRGLRLTPAGETALDYANAIFALGDELTAVLRGAARPRSVLLRVGVTDSVPKLQSVRLLQPVIDAHRNNLELTCREGRFVELLAQVAAGELDVVLADTAVPANLARSLQARALTQSGTSFVAARAMAEGLSKRFPKSLDEAPYVAGSAPTSLRSQAVDAWFAEQSVRPRVVGHVDDSALLTGFAEAGLGIIAVPTSIESEVLERYGLALVGRTEAIRQAVFLVRARVRRPHPLVSELEQRPVESGA